MKRKRSWGDRLLMHYAVDREPARGLFKFQEVNVRHYGSASGCKRCRVMREESRLYAQSPTVPSWWAVLDILIIAGLGIRIYMAVR